MRAWTPEVLVCPACRGALEGGAGADTVLGCAACQTFVPVIEGFPLFTETAGSRPDLAALKTRLFGAVGDYAAFETAKARRGAVEAYAAFHPFNESTRVIEAFLPWLDAVVQPGDRILDLWCRTGWSGEWLAARFPRARVISLWEADSGVLGYRGWRRWLGEDRRAPNLDVVFADPGRPLPFADGAFVVVHAADLLHRHGFAMAQECLRLTAPDGLTLFPHVHLSNNEPDPWFERGGVKRHGREYRAWIDGLGGGRKGWVLGEAGLFEQGAAVPLADQADTDDHNGFVLVAGRETPAPATARPGAAQGGQLLLNPLFRLSFSRRSARVEGALHGGAAAHLLDRHLVYRNALPQRPVPLTERQFLTLALAAAGEPVEVTAEIDPLFQAELLRPAGVGPAMVELQRFHANQRPVSPRAALVAELLAGLAENDAVVVRTPEGETATGRELMEAADALGPDTDHHEGPLGLAAALARMQAGRPLDLRCGGETLRLDPALLLEAAWSIRRVVSPGDMPGADVADALTLLAALTALVAGEVVVFGA